ncbi:MAG: hypothetical protein ACREPN_06665, partial [Rudaea sp.]
ALVRTRALRLEKQRKEQKDLRAKAFVRTELKSKKEEKATSVQKSTKAKSVRTARARASGSGLAKYLITAFRHDLKAAGANWRAFALQLWSALHPDPQASKPMRPIADVWRYAGVLLERLAAEQFRSPPQIAQTRRDRARAERRKVTAGKHYEAQRLAEVTALLAQGQYPGLGSGSRKP